MYIEQPELEVVENLMQKIYISEKGEDGKSGSDDDSLQNLENLKDVVNKNLTEAEENKDKLEKENEMEANDSVNSSSIEKSKKIPSGVPFNSLNLEEKLDSLKAIPLEMVKMLYLFKTSKKIYQGYFVSSNNGVITIQLMGRNRRINIPLEELEDILFKGF